MQGRIVDTPYPGGTRISWPHVVAACGHESQQSFQDVVYQRGCKQCTDQENGRNRRSLADPGERQIMLSAGIMPDPDIPFPGINKG